MLRAHCSGSGPFFLTMANTIQVFHAAFEDKPKLVATVTSNERNVHADLENAFQWTQNVYDSWSMKGLRDGNKNVVVETALNEINGEVWGIRSTSVGDFMVVNDQAWEVSYVGFTRLEL